MNWGKTKVLPASEELSAGGWIVDGRARARLLPPCIFSILVFLVFFLYRSGDAYAKHTLCSPFPPACACVCGSGSVTSVRTRSWLLWRWRRGRQRRNMTHGMLSGSSESGSRAWPRLWKRARCLRWKPRCVFARSFARFVRSSAAHPGAACSPSGFLAEDARLRWLQQCS